MNLPFQAVHRLIIRIPFSAPFPVPTIIAVDVASPSAHGHAITITEVKAINAYVYDQIFEHVQE